MRELGHAAAQLLAQVYVDLGKQITVGLGVGSGFSMHH